MPLNLTNYLSKANVTSTNPFALSIITDSEQYALSVDRTTENTDVRTVPITVSSTQGALFAPDAATSGSLVFYDQDNTSVWSKTAASIASGNNEGFVTFAVDESNEKICHLIGHASTGNVSDEYVHFYYNEIDIQAGTNTTGSENTDLLSTTQGATLNTANNAGKTFGAFTATEYKCYWYDSTADDIRTITANRTTKVCTLGTLGMNGSGQSGFIPTSCNYVSADETIVAFFQIDSNYDMIIEVAYSDATTGFWHYNSFIIWDVETGVTFPHYMDTGGINIQFWLLGDYLWMGRYTDSGNGDFIGNRAFKRSEFDQWLLSLMTTGT